MSQQAVMAFLSHWYKCQEAGKTWPLKFLKPQRQVFQEDEDPADGGHSVRISDSNVDNIVTLY